MGKIFVLSVTDHEEYILRYDTSTTPADYPTGKFLAVYMQYSDWSYNWRTVGIYSKTIILGMERKFVACRLCSGIYRTDCDVFYPRTDSSGD